MLDRLIDEARTRFDLGDQAGPLVDVLLEMVTDRDHGRIQGFLTAFREEGMEREVDSWVAEGPGAELGGPEVETGLGPGLVEEVAGRFGLDAVNVAAALGFLIPRVLDALTPGGDVPGDELLLARVEALRTGAAAGVAAESAAPTPTGPSRRAETPPATGPDARPAAPPDVRHEGGPRRVGVFGWLLPLIVLLALIWWVAGRCAPETETPQATEAAGLRDGRSVAESESLAGARSRPARRPAASAPESEPAPEPAPPPVPPTEPDREVEAAAGEADATPETPATSDSGDAAEALADLDPDFTPDELAAALNRGRIDFAASSAAVSPAVRATLAEAAKAILALPSGTRLEIAGHTDAAGEPRRNQRLSQARAEAVRNVLVDLGVPAGMLVPRGYGDSRPVASNDSAEGRRRNRRIEFAVIEE